MPETSGLVRGIIRQSAEIQFFHETLSTNG
uniref:Uncharacterized protein n=1 Tax=virus sp. ct5rm7 TaxID=2827298 RepID=A0A8S5RFY7_9VIRU|nr:MAG TPA: hypothetical protein [virus sp. ct5rm7]